MSEELVEPTSVSAPAPAPAPEAPAPEQTPAPAPEPEPVPEPTHEIDRVLAEVDRVNAHLVREVVEHTHHLGVSLLHEHSHYVSIPANEKHGPRIEQHIGR